MFAGGSPTVGGLVGGTNTQPAFFSVLYSDSQKATPSSAPGEIEARYLCPAYSRIALATVCWRFGQSVLGVLSFSSANWASAAFWVASAARAFASAIAARATAAFFSNSAARSFASAAELLATTASNPASLARSIAMTSCDCCFVLIPSSKPNSRSVHTASITTPTNTAATGIERIFGASSITPSPTSAPPTIQPTIRMIWGQVGSSSPPKNWLVYEYIVAVLVWLFAGAAVMVRCARQRLDTQSLVDWSAPDYRGRRVRPEVSDIEHRPQQFKLLQHGLRPRHHVRGRMLAASQMIVEQRLHHGYALADFPDSSRRPSCCPLTRGKSCRRCH